MEAESQLFKRKQNKTVLKIFGENVCDLLVYSKVI